MKKLIILSAIALSGLIYNSANAQGRVEARFRYSHDNYRDAHFYNRERPFYAHPEYYNDHVAVDRYRFDRHFYPEYRHDRDVRYRGWR